MYDISVSNFVHDNIFKETLANDNNSEIDIVATFIFEQYFNNVQWNTSDNLNLISYTAEEDCKSITCNDKSTFRGHLSKRVEGCKMSVQYERSQQTDDTDCEIRHAWWCKFSLSRDKVINAGCEYLSIGNATSPQESTLVRSSLYLIELLAESVNCASGENFR